MNNKMNKIDLFNNLSFDEKVKCVWLQATFLMSKNSATHRINLYSHDNYFIQLNYNFIDCKIEKIEATELNNVLDNYLDEIEIENLF